MDVEGAGSSQTCTECGVRDKASRQGTVFACTYCDWIGDADVVGAVNAQRRAVLALPSLEAADARRAAARAAGASARKAKRAERVATRAKKQKATWAAKRAARDAEINATAPGPETPGAAADDSQRSEVDRVQPPGLVGERPRASGRRTASAKVREGGSGSRPPTRSRGNPGPVNTSGSPGSMGSPGHKNTSWVTQKRDL